MGIPSGDWYIDDTLTWTVNTHTVTTGAATDADSVPTYRIYEDETGTPILTGKRAKKKLAAAPAPAPAPTQQPTT